MALRALRATMLALLPSLALAQTGTVTVNPTEVNQADCAGTGTVSLQWSSTFTTGDTFRLVADSSCPTTAPAQNAATTLADDVAATGTTQSQSVTVASIRTAVGASCTAINDTAVKVCVYRIAGGGTGTSTLVNSADFTFQTAIPPAPVNVTATPANQAIEVSYGAGTTGGNYQADTLEYAVEWAPQGSTTFTRTSKTSSTTLRVGGLTNGVTYDARVIGFSSAGNESPASATVSATPEAFLDFWTRYKDANGREQGGCGMGGAGGLAALLLGVALFLRRRP